MFTKCLEHRRLQKGEPQMFLKDKQLSVCFIILQYKHQQNTFYAKCMIVKCIFNNNSSSADNRRQFKIILMLFFLKNKIKKSRKSSLN